MEVKRFSLCDSKNISFLWKSLTLELKLKKFYPIIKMTTLKEFEAYFMTLELDDSRCRIHSISDGNEEIVTNQRYVVMQWKIVTRHSTNMTRKEVVEEIKARKEERKLVSKFEIEHGDEIDEILGLIDCIDQGYIEEKFPEIYDFSCERLGINLKNRLVIESYTTDFPMKRGHNQLSYFKKTFRAYQHLDECAF